MFNVICMKTSDENAVETFVPEVLFTQSFNSKNEAITFLESFIATKAAGYDGEANFIDGKTSDKVIKNVFFEDPDLEANEQYLIINCEIA